MTRFGYWPLALKPFNAPPLIQLRCLVVAPQLSSRSDARNAALAAVLATIMGGNVLGAGVVFCGDTDEKQSTTKG